MFASRLVGHSLAIYQLQANYSGTLLASGGVYAVICRFYFNGDLGYDGTIVWDLEKSKQLQVPQPPNPRGQVTALRWITGTLDSCDTLCIGTSSGWLSIWQHDLDAVSIIYYYQSLMTDDYQNEFVEVYSSPVCPDQITDIQFDKYMDSDTFRICVCARGGIIQVWHIRTPSSDRFSNHPCQVTVKNIFSVKGPVLKPRSVGFVDDGTMQMKVRILGQNGEM